MKNGFRQLDTLVVTRRLPGERNDIKEFVRPNDIAVREVYESLHLDSKNPKDKVATLLDWVCTNIRYPEDVRTSRLIAFDGFSVRINDYWPFPAETLAEPRIGDCDSCSNLLVSLMRRCISYKDVYAVLGSYKSAEMNHAWVEWNSMILEPTKDIPPERMFEEAQHYTPMVYYNDEEIWVRENCNKWEWLTQTFAESVSLTVRARVPNVLVDSITYQDVSKYRSVELGKFRIADVPDPVALFAAIENEVARQGDILVKQELWSDADSYLLKVWVAPMSPIFWWLIPIAITAVAGAVTAWQVTRISVSSGLSWILPVTIIAIAGIAGIYLLTR